MFFMMMGKYCIHLFIEYLMLFLFCCHRRTVYQLLNGLFSKSLPVSVLMSASSCIANIISALPTVLAETQSVNKRKILQPYPALEDFIDC